jgi:K(+)-stimulated pyrophosphate-energized sodium pump
MNPVIKFSTLFGILAVELAVELDRSTSLALGVAFSAIMFFFVWRSFHSMRIGAGVAATTTVTAPGE